VGPGGGPAAASQPVLGLMGRRPDPDRPRPSEVAGGTVTPVVGGVHAGEPNPANFSSKQLAWSGPTSE
jgi:hypothetical protein